VAGSTTATTNTPLTSRDHRARGSLVVDYKKWLFENLCQQLLAPGLITAHGQAEALRGLSFSER
jgi:hypothetical protein